MTVSESQGIDVNAIYETQAYNLYGQNIKCTSYFQFCGSHHYYQVPGLMAIMSFQTSRSRVADIISLTLPAPNQDFTLSSIFFFFVFPCFFSSLVYQWWENVLNPPFSLHGQKLLLVVFLSSAPMMCWFLPPSIPSHLFSSLSMICATFFPGTTFLPPLIYSECACLTSMPHTRTSRSAGYSIKGLSVSLCCCWLGMV